MKKIFLKNFFNLIVNQGVNILVAIIATPILFQKLGESSFGLMNLSWIITQTSVDQTLRINVFVGLSFLIIAGVYFLLKNKN